MATFVGGVTAYCTPSQFLERYDARTVGDLLSDSGTRLTPGEILTSPILQSLLKQASGEIESAAFVEGRFTPELLTSLTGNSAQFLAGLTADLAMYLLYKRRPERVGQIPPAVSMVYQTLEALRQGHRVFPFKEIMDAGRTLKTIARPDDSMVNQARRFFGRLVDTKGKY